MTDVKLKLESIKTLVLDFDGVFTDNKVYINQKGEEMVMCDRGDGMGLELLRKKTNIDILVLSKETNPVVSARCRKLNIECYQSIENKIELLKKIINKKGQNLQETCYVGNDINDSECLKAVGIPTVVSDAHSSVIPLAKLVLRKKGGHGAIRELCDMILDNKNITSQQ